MAFVSRIFAPGGGRSSARRQALALTLLVVLVLGVTGGALWSIYHASPASAGVARTVTVERGVVQESVSASGNISPATTADADFTTGGTVTSVRVAAGEQVKAGQILATVDPSQAEANLQSAEASLQSAEATLSDDDQGGTAGQVDQNAVTVAQQLAQLTSDEQLLAADQTTLSQADQQLSADQALGCPPAPGSSSAASSQSSSGSGSGTTSGSGSAFAADSSPAAVPVVTTGAASSVMTTTAELNGTIEGGAGVSYYFDYGTTTSYGHTTGWERASGSGVAADVTGLAPDTTYIFRLVAADSAGTADGSPQYFTTADSSCVTDQQQVTTDQEAVQHQQATVSEQQSTITATEAGQAVQPSTVAQAQAQVAEAKLTVTEDEKALAGTTLTAPISGTVTAVNGTVGETVSSGTGSTSTASSATSSSTGTGSGSSASGAGSSGTGSSSTSSSAFVTIASLGDLEVVVGFPEAEATSIAVGQPATVTLSALTNTEVGGKVVAVSDVSTVVSNVVTYDETIALDNPPSSVKDGMTALVAVVVATADDVLEVPSAAITTAGALSTVTVKHGTSTQVVRVTLGLVGNSSTQITSGVTAGETLVEPTATVSSTAGTSTSTGRTGVGGGFGGGGFFPGAGG
jgi:HlyD family secretion protein